MPLFWSVILFLTAITVHEYAHGWVAYRLGDPTAKLARRLTLNPLAHMDLIGTVLLPITLIWLHSPMLFGWAKPVPINALALRHPHRDLIWVGAAGPLANLICAVALSLVIKGLRLPSESLMTTVITSGILINLVLACFNIIPIPPLDGSRVLFGLLPTPIATIYARLEPYGFLLVLLLLYLGVMNAWIWPAVVWLMRKLVGP